LPLLKFQPSYLYLCHLLVVSSPTLMMHGHANLKYVRTHRIILVNKLDSNKTNTGIQITDIF